MGKVFGTKQFRDQADTEQGIEYPPLPRPLLRMIYEGEGIQVSCRAHTYVILLGKDFINADEVSLSKWLLRTWGEKLNHENFHIANMLLAERIRAEIKHAEIEQRRLEREERRAMTGTWTPGNELNSFFGRNL